MEEMADQFRLDFRKSIVARRSKEIYKLPDEPVPDEQLIARCKEEGAKASKRVADGNLSGSVFTADEKHWKVVHEVMGYNGMANTTFYNDFAFARQCEAECVKMALNMYNAPEDACGIATLGGTESIFVATQSYREYGRIHRGISRPNVVASESAHVAIDKSCHWLGIELRTIKLTGNLRFDVKAMKKCIDSNTLFVYASAPDFALGAYDPISEIGAYAERWGCGVHVDACMGGFINPFMEGAGFKPDEINDFRVPGVTTISCDYHKFGLAPKGSSVIMFRNRELRRVGIFAKTTWTGGLYATNGSAGTRNGGNYVGTWVAMLRLGRKGYTERVKRVLEATQNLRNEIRKIPELIVLNPHVSHVTSVSSKVFNPISIGDHLYTKYKWSIIKIQNPSGFHLTMTDANAHRWKDFADDIKRTVEEFKNDPKLSTKEAAALYGAAAKIPHTKFVSAVLRTTMEEVADTHVRE